MLKVSKLLNRVRFKLSMAVAAWHCDKDKAATNLANILFAKALYEVYRDGKLWGLFCKGEKRNGFAEVAGPNAWSARVVTTLDLSGCTVQEYESPSQRRQKQQKPVDDLVSSDV